jgi:hypothetical protein
MTGTSWIKERGTSIWIRLPRGGGVPANVPKQAWFLYMVHEDYFS